MALPNNHKLNVFLHGSCRYSLRPTWL